ncbi:MAG: hypothetical protein EPN46_00280 [Candidimonas sp.]|nr:MAG: hypothetical protein EPN77_14845 [Candidimonas sp.]TAM23193.1 MAG: hypothetical protein EPN62_10035 [Candidimonas sp.]TAM81258.1 MAG: hypothetical protein EPN46_00280 [Candidimonas sp.]
MPSLACSGLHQVLPPIRTASERGRWMPQCSQRTIDSRGGLGGLLRLAACLGWRSSASSLAFCCAIMRAMNRPPIMTTTQNMTFPTLTSLQYHVEHKSAARIGQQ